MGNSTVKPIAHAHKTYSEFTDDKRLKKLVTNSNNKPEVIAKFHRYFCETLEDFMVNDQVYNEFPENNKIAVIGTLLQMQSVGLYILNSGAPPKWNIEPFCKAFAKGKSLKNVLDRAVSTEFLIENGKYHRFNGNIWVPCEEKEIRLERIEEKIDLNPEFRPIDFESPIITAGLAWIQAMFSQLNELVATYNDDTTGLIEEVHKNDVHLNAESYKLPFYSSTVDFTEASLSHATPMTDLFTVRLPYDPVKRVTPLAKQFLENFSCDASELASAIVRWGCRTKPTLTLVIGSSDSGKTILARYVQSLYGPFVSTGDMTSLVRTVFIDNEDPEFITNETAVREHPGVNVVYLTQNDLSLDRKFGGRRVHRLKLEAPITPEKRNPNILPCVTTRKQLASGMGWCLSNCDPESIAARGSGELNQLLRMFARQHLNGTS